MELVELCVYVDEIGNKNVRVPHKMVPPSHTQRVNIRNLIQKFIRFT